MQRDSVIPQAKILHSGELDIKILILKEKARIQSGLSPLTISIIVNWTTNSAIDKYIYMNELSRFGGLTSDFSGKSAK